MTIHYDVVDHVASITIDRTGKHNALNRATYAALAAAWRQVRDDPDVRAAIITGAGDRSFCAGADLDDVVADPTELGDFWLTQHEPLLNRGLEIWKPVIAAVNGYCLGAGMTMLLATDLRVCSPHASFGLPEVTRGTVAANGGTQRLLHQVPHAIAMRMLLTGESLTAQEAERWGLVNRIVDHDELMPTAQALARQAAENAPLAVQASKELALRSRNLDLVDGLRLEQAVARLLKFTSDASEGPSAFRERRAPEFRGQ